MFLNLLSRLLVLIGFVVLFNVLPKESRKVAPVLSVFTIYISDQDPDYDKDSYFSLWKGEEQLILTRFSYYCFHTIADTSMKQIIFHVLPGVYTIKFGPYLENGFEKEIEISKLRHNIDFPFKEIEAHNTKNPQWKSGQNRNEQIGLYELYTYFY